MESRVTQGGLCCDRPAKAPTDLGPTLLQCLLHHVLLSSPRVRLLARLFRILLFGLLLVDDVSVLMLFLFVCATVCLFCC